VLEDEGGGGLQGGGEIADAVIAEQRTLSLLRIFDRSCYSCEKPGSLLRAGP
jgi:hypothetical protein